MTDGAAHDEATNDADPAAAYGDLYDEILRKEFGDGGVPQRPPAPAEDRPAIVAEVDAGDEVDPEAEPGEEEPEPIGAAHQRRVRYGGAAVIALGGAACAVVGGLLGGLGAGTTVNPASVHSMVDGKPAAGADLPSGFPALVTTPLGHTGLVGDRVPLTVVPTPLATVGGGPVGSGPSAPVVVAAEPTTTTTAPPSSTTTTTAPPSSTTTTTAPPSGTPGLPAPASGLGGIVATVGGTVTQLTSGLLGLPTSGGTAPGTASTCSGGSVVSGATSMIGSLPVVGGTTSPSPCNR